LIPLSFLGSVIDAVRGLVGWRISGAIYA